MAGKIKADIIQGETSLKLNVGETTLLVVDASNYNVAQPLNVQSTSVFTGAAEFNGTAQFDGAVTFNDTLTFAGSLGDVTAGDLSLTGNLTVGGTQTIINTATLDVEDKNIQLANVASPDDTTANGAGLTILGATNKTFQWELPKQAFRFNQGIDIRQVTETTNTGAVAPLSTENFDVLEGAIKYFTSDASANWTINIRGNASNTFNSITNTGDSVTVTYAATQGSTAYYQSALQIDGYGRTVKWQGGSAPSAGNSNSIDIYSFTILKTASNTYTVLGAQTQFA